MEPKKYIKMKSKEEHSKVGLSSTGGKVDMSPNKSSKDKKKRGINYFNAHEETGLIKEVLYLSVIRASPLNRIA